MDENNMEQSQSLHESIKIYSRKKKYIGLILCMSFLFAIIGFSVFEYLDDKSAKIQAKDNYEDYYDEVYDFLKDVHKEYEEANGSEEHDSEYDDGVGYQKTVDSFIDMMTLGEYSASDPTKFEDEKKYLLHMANNEYNEFMNESPKYVIAKGIINNWNEDKTIEEIINDKYENQWFSNKDSLDLFDILAFILTFAIFIPISIVICFFVKRKSGYVNIIGDTVKMNGEAPINISDIKDIKTKPFGTICIQTNEKVYKRHHIAYVKKLANVINNQKNYDIDSEEEQ